MRKSPSINEIVLYIYIYIPPTKFFHHISHLVENSYIITHSPQSIAALSLTPLIPHYLQSIPSQTLK